MACAEAPVDHSVGAKTSAAAKASAVVARNDNLRFSEDACDMIVPVCIVMMTAQTTSPGPNGSAAPGYFSTVSTTAALTISRRNFSEKYLLWRLRHVIPAGALLCDARTDGAPCR